MLLIHTNHGFLFVIGSMLYFTPSRQRKSSEQYLAGRRNRLRGVPLLPFPCTSRTIHLIRWDSLEGDGTKTGDILVIIYREDLNASRYFGVDSGFKDPLRIGMKEGADILIEVKGYTANQAKGTYALMYIHQVRSGF
jgi:hypothetical protein